MIWAILRWATGWNVLSKLGLCEPYVSCQVCSTWYASDRVLMYSGDTLASLNSWSACCLFVGLLTDHFLGFRKYGAKDDSNSGYTSISVLWIQLWICGWFILTAGTGGKSLVNKNLLSKMYLHAGWFCTTWRCDGQCWWCWALAGCLCRLLSCNNVVN